MAIEKIILREIIDSRGNKTIEAEVHAGDFTAIAAAPSGASVGSHEVPAFPKGGTEEAISVFKTNFRDKLVGMEANYHDFDRTLRDLDPNRSHLGGNTSIALSFAVAKLHAAFSEIDLYELFSSEYTLPYPLGNIIGGGLHAGAGSPELQEFLCIPVGARSFKEAALANARVHHIVGKTLSKMNKNFTRGRGDEGAWAPAITNQKALEVLSEACNKASGEIEFKIRPAMDLAASELWHPKTGKYVYKNSTKTQEEQIEFVAGLVDTYGIYYLEDALQEDDFSGFAELNKRVGSKCLVVGDDLTVTNPERLQTAIDTKSCNSLIIKPNQIGSLIETEDVIELAKKNKIVPVVSHRSGETTDSTIAHLAVGHSIPIIKTGAVGGERLAKINELIRLEEKTMARMAHLKL